MSSPDKELIEVIKVDLGLASVLARTCELFIAQRLLISEGEKRKEELSAQLEEVMREWKWVDSKVMAGEYEITMVAGATLDKIRFNDFLEGKGVDKGLLSEAWLFAKKPTAAKVRVRKV